MKKYNLFFAIALSTFVWMGCDNDDDNILERETLNDTDETFVEVAARSNMAEIRFGELAATKATDATVKSFAQQMVTEHQTAQNELEQLENDFDGIEWPDDLDEGHEDMLAELNDAEGYSFDSLYVKNQVLMHENAVTVFRNATTNSTNARVKAYAVKYLPTLEMHLEEARSLETSVITNNGDPD